MYQEGEISIVECSKCGESFPDFTFVADSDMLTIDCVALTGKDKSIVLTKRGSDEGCTEIESRIGFDFSIVKVRHVKQPTIGGMSFKKFRKQYKPPQAIYSCIYCGADSFVTKKETKEQFLSHGNIKVLNDS